MNNVTDGDELFRRGVRRFLAPLRSSQLDLGAEWSKHVERASTLVGHTFVGRHPGLASGHRQGRLVAAISFAAVIGLVAAFIATGTHSGGSSATAPFRGAGSNAAATQPRSNSHTPGNPGGCRLVPMKLSGVTHEPDGTTIYHFTGNGESSDEYEYVPADNFDPLTATNAQLIANGFPPRPPGNNAAALKARKVAMEHAKHAVVSVPVMAIGSGCSNHRGLKNTAPSSDSVRKRERSGQ
jgi:hypothetical protein